MAIEAPHDDSDHAPADAVIAPFADPAMFTPAECAEIIRIAEGMAFGAAGLVLGRRNESIRAARTVWLEEAGRAEWVYARVLETALAANRGHFAFTLSEFGEKVQIACYDATEAGHFDWHSDRGDGPFAARRKLTLVAQLSEPAAYEGGALELNATGRPESASRALGAAILFPSFVLHRVTPVTTRRRYSLTTWVHGPDFI